MYLQPYGDEQQLNLNWIITEIINLHKQLDPDYETPSFTQIYPYSNLNRLNLDWILSELKALKELAPEPTPIADIQAVAEALVALPFDSNTSYQIYDFISRDGEIWRATEAIPAGGEWDSSKWFKTKIGTDLAVLERWINTINNSLTAEIEARQSADTAIERTIANLNNAREDILDDCNNFILGVKKVAPQTLNMPENAYGFIESYTAQNGNWKWQFLTTTQTPQKIFKRANINNADWTAWVRIADNTDVESLQGSLNSETAARQNAETALQDSINTNESAIAIVADGNTHSAIASEQYIFVKNHSALASGLYKALSAIPLNGAITATNVAPVSNGGFNSILNETIKNVFTEHTLTINTTYLQNGSKLSYYEIGNLIIAVGSDIAFKTALSNSAESNQIELTNTHFPPTTGNILFAANYFANLGSGKSAQRFRISSTGQFTTWWDATEVSSAATCFFIAVYLKSN